MKKPVISITKYESSPHSPEKALNEVDAFKNIGARDRALIKPNLVGWDPHYPIAPFGVYMNSRLVKDMAILLKDHSIREIVIGEGSARKGGEKSGRS